MKRPGAARDRLHRWCFIRAQKALQLLAAAVVLLLFVTVHLHIRTVKIYWKQDTLVLDIQSGGPAGAGAGPPNAGLGLTAPTRERRGQSGRAAYRGTNGGEGRPRRPEVAAPKQKGQGPGATRDKTPGERPEENRRQVQTRHQNAHGKAPRTQEDERPDDGREAAAPPPPPRDGPASRLPNVLLAGTQKAGTSAVAEWLFAGGVCRPATFPGEKDFHRKEVHFFDSNQRYARGTAFYRRRFAHCLGDGDEQRPREAPPRRNREGVALAMDATPDTMLRSQRVYDTYRDAGAADAVRILIALREPVSRLLSQYNMLRGENRTQARTLRDFAYQGGTKEGRLPSRHAQRGFYAEQLAEWFRRFPRERILLLSYNEILGDAARARERIARFLDLDVPATSWERVNDGPGRHKVALPSCAAQRELHELYRPHNRRLYAMLADAAGKPDMEQHPFPEFRLGNCTSADHPVSPRRAATPSRANEGAVGLASQLASLPAPDAARRAKNLSPSHTNSAIKLAICAIVKDEAPYLVEWIEHHTLIGFDSILLYNDGSADDTQCVLDAYARQGVVTRVPDDISHRYMENLPWNHTVWLEKSKNPNNPQFAIFESCRRYLIDEEVRRGAAGSTWMLTIDVDEFLWFDRQHGNAKSTLTALLNENSLLRRVIIPNCLFGPSGKEAFEREPVMRRFVHRDGNLHCRYSVTSGVWSLPGKSLSRVSALVEGRTIDPHTHRVLNSTEESWPRHWQKRIALGVQGDFLAVLPHLRLAHYKAKSREEFYSRVCGSSFYDKYYLPYHMFNKRGNFPGCCSPASFFDYMGERFTYEDNMMLPFADEIEASKVSTSTGHCKTDHAMMTPCPKHVMEAKNQTGMRQMKKYLDSLSSPNATAHRAKNLSPLK